MSYNLGIRTAASQYPIVRWTLTECVVCKAEVWVPGKRSLNPAACADHEAATGNIAAYLEQITDVG